MRDDAIREQIRRAAQFFPPEDYLCFNPSAEPPPNDVPQDCPQCGAENPRGRRTCRRCNTPLAMRSRYDVWYDALITTYSGDRYGVTLGAPYAQVIRWLPTMRPYRGREGGANPEFEDTVFAITHVVYTLNDYNLRRLSPQSLPGEFAFLKANLKEAIALEDPEMLGEFLDSLRAFGLSESDPLIRQGMEYLLSHQNPDGSWGDMHDSEIYNRYHPTWTAVDGLREYAFSKEGFQQRSLPLPLVTAP